MTNMETKITIKKLNSYIKDNLTVMDDDIDIAVDDNIFQKGYVNSLFAMKLLNYIETEFGVEFDDDDIDLRNFSTITNMHSLIKSKKAAQIQ